MAGQKFFQRTRIAFLFTLLCLALISFLLPKYTLDDSRMALALGLGLFTVLFTGHLIYWAIGVTARRRQLLTDIIDRLDSQARIIEQNQDMLRLMHVQYDIRRPRFRGHLDSEIRILKTIVEKLGKIVIEEESTADESNQDKESQAHNQEKLLTLLRNALEESRVDLYMQSIVKLPNRKVMHYETLSRVRDESGSVIFPAKQHVVPMDSELLGTMDSILLFRCILLLRKLGPRKPGVKLFCNLSYFAINNHEFLVELNTFISNESKLAKRLVFEMAYKDFCSIPDNTREDIIRLGRLGVQFSLDHIPSTDIDISSFETFNINFIKIDARLLLEPEQEEAVSILRSKLRDRGIHLIATRIEDEKEVIHIVEMGVDYGQGFLFSMPQPVREINQPAQQAAE